MSCCVVGCQNRKSLNKNLHFYRIPSSKTPFNANRRRLWLQAIRRTEWKEELIHNARLCSAHFISGAVSMNLNSPDFVPSIFPHLPRNETRAHAKLERFERKRKRDEPTYHRPLMDGDGPQVASSLELCTDVRKVIVGEEHQQAWSSTLDQEDPEPPHIKEEQEELWISQADITKFPSPPVPVKSEDDEEKPQSSQLHQRQTEQMETEADGEDCGEPEPARNSDPDTEDKSGDSSEPETEDSADWNETREHQSGLNSLKIVEVPVSDSGCSTAKKPFSCSECGKRFGHKGDLNRHMRTHTGQKPFSCTVCQKSFTESGNLHKHTRIHTGEKPFGCSVCAKRFLQSADLKRHIRTHTGDKRFSCSVCGKRFLQNTDLKRHMMTHTGEGPFSCSFCGHVSIHTGEKRFSCSICNQRFTIEFKNHKYVGLQSSQLHQSQTENREAEPPASSSTQQIKIEADGEDCGGPEPSRNSDPDTHLQPDTEDKSEDSSETETEDSGDWKETREPQSGLNSLKNVEVPVSGSRCSAAEKPFSCSKCGKRFDLKKVLKIHMRIHTGEKPFSCSVCKKSFAQGGTLQKHMKIHTGEKPFSCSVCQKYFRNSGDLQRHTRIHTGERPFSCSECGRRFVTTGNLKDHMTMHTGEKPFSCSVCGKHFKAKSTMTRHMRVHTGEERFSCSVCCKRFASPEQLKNHLCVGRQSNIT